MLLLHDGTNGRQHLICDLLTHFIMISHYMNSISSCGQDMHARKELDWKSINKLQKIFEIWSLKLKINIFQTSVNLVLFNYGSEKWTLTNPVERGVDDGTHQIAYSSNSCIKYIILVWYTRYQTWSSVIFRKSFLMRDSREIFISSL